MLTCGKADSLFDGTKQCFAWQDRGSLERPRDPSQVSDDQMNESVSRGDNQDVQVQ